MHNIYNRFNREMNKHFNHRGITLIETVAAVTIISLVLVSAFTIALNSRAQLLAQERRLLAQQEITLVRNRILAHTNPQHLENWMNSESLETIDILSDNCLEFNDFILRNTLTTEASCAILFEDSLGNVHRFSEVMTIQFIVEDDEDPTSLTFIRVIITAEFQAGRFVEVEGLFLVN